MESVSAMLGGLGMLGMLAAFLLGFVTLLVLPFWAIIDCANSTRSGGAKATIIILLLFTWGPGSVFYGLFLPGTRALRIVTVVAVAGILTLAVPSTVSLLAGAGIHSKIHAEQIRQENQQIAAQFTPAAVPARAIGSFNAVHFTYTPYGPATAAVARFTGPGPDFDSARDTDRNVRQVAFDSQGGRYWALTSHDFGSIDPATGRFHRIQVDPSLGDFSWPKGVAYDSKNRKVYVMTSGVFTHFYRFDPAGSTWEQLPAEPRGLSILGLTWLPSDGCLYALEYDTNQRALRRLQRFNTEGASLGAVDLRMAVPVPDDAESLFQIQATADRLVLILPPLKTSDLPVVPPTGGSRVNRVFVIDPGSGEVLAPGA